MKGTTHFDINMQTKTQPKSKNVIAKNEVPHFANHFTMFQTIIGHCFKLNSSIITIVHHKMIAHSHKEEKPQSFGTIPIVNELEQFS